MNLEETEKIINSLIDTFILSGNVSLDLRNKGLKKKLNLTIHLLQMEIFKLTIY